MQNRHRYIWRCSTVTSAANKSSQCTIKRCKTLITDRLEKGAYHRISRTEDKTERCKAGGHDDTMMCSCSVCDWRQKAVWMVWGNGEGVAVPPFWRFFCIVFAPLLKTTSCLTLSPISCTVGHMIKQMKAAINRIWWIALVAFMPLTFTDKNLRKW